MRPGARFQSRTMEPPQLPRPELTPGAPHLCTPVAVQVPNGSHRTCTWPSNSRAGATALVRAHGRPPRARTGQSGLTHRLTTDALCFAERSPAGETLNKDPPRTRPIPPAAA